MIFPVICCVLSVAIAYVFAVGGAPTWFVWGWLVCAGYWLAEISRAFFRWRRLRAYRRYTEEWVRRAGQRGDVEP